MLWLADRWGHRSGARIGTALIVPALALHALTDGAALAVAAATARHDVRGGLLLGAALLLHRLPEGLFLASTLAPVVGWRGAVIRIAAIAVATAIGAFGGEAMLRTVPDTAVDAVIAFGLGAVLRLVTHSHAKIADAPGARALNGATFVVGALLAALTPTALDLLDVAQPDELALSRTLLPLFVETAPALLLGLAARAVLRTIRAPRHGVSRSATGDALGPELGLEAVGLLLRMFGPVFAVVRLLASVAIACLLDRTMEFARRVGPHRLPSDEPAANPEAAGQRMRADQSARRGARALRREFTEEGAWYLAGVFLAAAFEALAPADALTRLTHGSFAVLGVLLGAVAIRLAPVCVVPIAAVLVHKGATAGTAMAFVLLASFQVRPALAALRPRHGRVPAAAAIVARIALPVAIGLLLDATRIDAHIPLVHGIVEHRHRPIEFVIAVTTALGLTVSVLDRGARDWFSLPDPHAHGTHADEPQLDGKSRA